MPASAEILYSSSLAYTISSKGTMELHTGEVPYTVTVDNGEFRAYLVGNPIKEVIIRSYDGGLGVETQIVLYDGHREMKGSFICVYPKNSREELTIDYSTISFGTIGRVTIFPGGTK